MSLFIEKAYYLINEANEPITLTKISGKIDVQAGIGRDLLVQAQTAVRASTQLKRQLRDQFCPDRNLDFKQELETKVYKLFDQNARQAIDAMMQKRNEVLSGVELAPPYHDVPLPSDVISDDDPSESQNLAKFNTYCLHVKKRLPAILKTVYENVGLAEKVVKEKFIDGCQLPRKEKNILRGAIEREVTEFKYKVESIKMCSEPADSDIDSVAKIVTETAKQWDGHELALRHKYVKALLQEFKNVSFRLICL